MFESRILFFISFCVGDIVQVQFPFYIIQKVYLKNDEISHYRYVFGLRYCVLMNDTRDTWSRKWRKQRMHRFSEAINPLICCFSLDLIWNELGMQLIKHIWFQNSRASLSFVSNFATLSVSIHEGISKRYDYKT